MSNVSSLNRQAKTSYKRLLELYRIANDPSLPSSDLLPTALRELGIVSEALEIGIKELIHQTERLAIAQSDLDAERQRYQDLFEFMSDGCITTDANMVILEVNCVGAALLNTQPQSLVGKPFSNLIFADDLPLFQAKILQLLQSNRVGNGISFSVRLCQHPIVFFHAALTPKILRKNDGEIAYMQWLLQDITERKRAEAALENPDYNPGLDYPTVQYSKGETIPFEPQMVWFVIDGVVKLTTLSDRGEEMLVGLVGEPMVFGSSLTALHTYQAIALSNVKLAPIPLSAVAQSPRLAQALFSSLKQRLQQTESLLAIYGQIRVEERLNNLLMLLKQAIGQPIEQGVRLRARLTHQDFASACCTTRVTVTRLLGKLQEQGKLAFDAQNHLVLKE